MMRGAWLILSASLLTACIAYPKTYWHTYKGRAYLENATPVVIKAQLLKHCESLQGETDKIIRERQTTTDSSGNYKLAIGGFGWNVKRFSTDTGCETRVQLFICREVCKPVDEIDINVLGK